MGHKVQWNHLKMLRMNSVSDELGQSSNATALVDTTASIFLDVTMFGYHD